MSHRACLTLALAAAGCTSSEEIIYDVQHFLTPCVVDELGLCPLVKTDAERDFSVLTEPVEGFDAEWGQTARIRVVRTEEFSGGANQIVRLTLDRVLETAPVDPGTNFTYRFSLQDQTAETQALTLEGEGGALLDGRAFACEPATVCEQLATFEGAGARGSVSLSLRYADPISEPFTAWDVALDSSAR